MDSYRYDYVGNLQGEVNDSNNKTHEDDSVCGVLCAACHCGLAQELH